MHNQTWFNYVTKDYDSGPTDAVSAAAYVSQVGGAGLLALMCGVGMEWRHAMLYVLHQQAPGGVVPEDLQAEADRLLAAADNG